MYTRQFGHQSGETGLSRNLCSALLTLAVMLGSLHGRIVAAADWPHWRGPQRNGTTPEPSGYRNGKWSLSRVAWETNVGVGSSSPLVVGDHLYATGWKEGKDYVTCLDVATGKTRWQQSYPCPKYGRLAIGDQRMYAGPSSTPEYDPETGRLYTLSTDGDLCCWDTRSRGTQVWSLNLHERYRISRRPRVGRSGRRDYGYTTSPLVWQSWLLVEVGAAEGSVVAFDKATGREAWRSDLRDPAGHTGGLVPMTVEGVPCVAVLTHNHLAVIRLDPGHEGKTVGKYPWITEYANNIATPAVQGQNLLVTSAYNHMAICKLEVTLRGVRKVWERPYPSGVCSPVIHRGKIYFAWRTIRCLDFATGKQLWSGGKTGYPGSCIVTADDRLIVWAARGRLLLADTADRSPRRLRILAEKENLGTDYAWPHVVLSGGRLFCKDRSGTIRCLVIGAP